MKNLIDISKESDIFEPIEIGKGKIVDIFLISLDSLKYSINKILC